jgi:hypothetical protein
MDARTFDIVSMTNTAGSACGFILYGPSRQRSFRVAEKLAP